MLDKKPEMRERFIAVMEKIFQNHHAEPAPPSRENAECWYLPNQIWVVFNTGAQYSGISLNDVLLTGPDLNNSLLGVLMQFTKVQVSILTDIKPMFHCFLVQEEHMNYLRFLWYRDNDMSEDIIDV